MTIRNNPPSLYFHQKKVRLAQFTFKEQEGFLLCKKGLSCKEMSEQLFVSIETIKTHRKKIIKKLSIHGKAEFRIFIMNLLAEELMSQHEVSP